MIARKPRRELLAIAVARGCDHYAPLWPDLRPEDDPALPHEVLGCALLRGPADEETFQSIRCGAMVLSDLGNSLGRIVLAAGELAVTGRVTHIARLGRFHDAHPGIWRPLLAALPKPGQADETFLPGVSRLVRETFVRGGGRGPERTWLRTAYR